MHHPKHSACRGGGAPRNSVIRSLAIEIRLHYNMSRDYMLLVTMMPCAKLQCAPNPHPHPYSANLISEPVLTTGHLRCGYRTCAFTTYTSPLMAFELCNICYCQALNMSRRQVQKFTPCFQKCQHFGIS